MFASFFQKVIKTCGLWRKEEPVLLYEPSGRAKDYEIITERNESHNKMDTRLPTINPLPALISVFSTK